MHLAKASFCNHTDAQFLYAFSADLVCILTLGVGGTEVGLQLIELGCKASKFAAHDAVLALQSDA